MKQKMKRTISFLLTLVCVLGLLPLSAFAASGLSDAPSTITQHNVDYLYVGGRPVRYDTASDIVNSAGAPYLFDVQVSVPGLEQTARALCSYHEGTLGSGANGQKWNYKAEVTHPSLVALLTWIYSCANGDFSDAGNAVGMSTWNEGWTNLWFMVAQSMTWYNEYGILIDYNTDREGFIRQVAEELLCAFKTCHDTWGWAQWVTDWDNADIYTIIDSADNGATGGSAYDYASVAMNRILDYPEYFHTYHLWEYEWDTSQPWKLSEQQNKPMQRLLIAIPDTNYDELGVSLTVKKLESGTNIPLAGATFKIENTVNPALFSVTRTTGTDGTITLTNETDGLDAGQYTITEVAAPNGYLKQNESTTVTVLPNSSADTVFTFYNSVSSGSGAIRKVDADNPTVGLSGAVIRITSIELDEGGSFSGTYITGDGGYISEDDLDFKNLPFGSYMAEEITPPQGYTLSTDPAKVRQTFTWDGIHNVSLVFENDAKVKIQLKKVDEGSNPLAGAVFIILKDGQIIDTGITNTAGEITVSNVSEGYYEFREVAAPAGFDKDPTPVGVYVNSEDLEGEQTITVTKVNYHKRSLTIEKRDSMTGDTIPGTVFYVRGINVAFEQDVTTGANGKFTLSSLPSGCYEITEKSVPSPWLLDTNNRRTIWIDAKQGQDVTVTFENSTRPGLRILKTDYETGQPVAGVTFLIEQVSGGYSEQHITDSKGVIFLENLTPGAYTITEVKPAPGYVADDLPRTVNLEANHTTTLELTNVKMPSLRIVKYDQQSGEPLSGATFEIYKDTVLLDTRTTDSNGEILLTYLEPGTYLVKEVSTDDAHVVNSTPQQIELKAGQTETQTLVFFNSLKPGIHLVKVDSVTMKSLPNARFEFSLVGGSYKQEFVTDGNGEIDLSKLTPGAYEVRELEAPDGYLIDDAVRVVQINPDENANFVFTNTPKPSLVIVKYDPNTGKYLAGATFCIAKIEDGTHYFDRITGSDGRIVITDLEPGVYSVQEINAPKGYILNDTEYHVELFAGQESQLVVDNEAKPTLKIIKTDAVTGDPVQGVAFTVKMADGRTITTEATNAQGEIILEDMDPGAVEIWEQSVPDNYIIDTKHQLITLVPNKLATVQFQNYQRPTLKIAKTDIDGKPLTGAIFTVVTKAGVTIGDFPVGSDGTVTIPNTQLDEGYYIVTEKQAPTGYILDTTPHEVYLRPGKTTEITIENEKKPGLTIHKIDSVVGDGVKGAKFEIWVSKDKNQNGTYQQLTSSYYYTDANGLIELENLDTGWYKIIEVEPPTGYMLANPSEQIIYVEHDASVEVTFENIPKSALIIRKVDADTGAPLANAWFRVRYLGGTSGTGGTVIGEYQTSSNGNIIITGLDAGTYICEEINAPSGYVMDTAPQTAYISGNSQDCITLTFTNSKHGALLIKKVDSVTGEQLSDVQFFVTDSDGSVIGNSNGYFTTDSAGTILISDIEPGTTLVVKETKTIDGYVLDETPQTIKITSNETKTLEFRNQPTGSLLIRKVCAVNPSVTLQNAEFKVTYADGTLIGDSGGVYRSDENGEVRIEGLTPGKSVVVTETRAPDGFIIDTQSQTIQIQAGKTVSLTFKNQPKGGIIVQKRDSITGQPLSGAEFRVTTAAGCEVGLDGVIGSSTLTQNGIFTTDSNGEIHISNLAPGAYVLTEIKAPAGYVMDAPSTNVVIGANGDMQTVVVTNTPKGNLVVEKYDSVTKQPLSGAQFKITTASGELVADNEGLTSSNGLYVTDENGQIVLSKLRPNTYIVTETIAPDNYQIDPTPQTVVVNAGDTQTLRFYDDPLCTLTILKRDAVTKKPLANAEFTVKDSEGRDIGKYVTGTDGTVTVTGLTPNGTYVVSETKAPTGYVLDETPKNIVVRSGAANSLAFENDPTTTLVIEKYVTGTTTPLKGVTFLVTDSSGAAAGNSNGEFITDGNGRIVITGLTPGTTITAREVKALEGYVLDSSPKSILIKAGEVQTLRFYNDKQGALVIRKLDSVTKQPLAGVEFQLTYANGGYVDNANGHLSSNGLYTTDANGEIRISGVTGTIVVTETRTIDGYTIDPATQTQTVTVNSADTQTLTFYNAPKQTLTIQKYVDGTTTPIQGVAFLVTDSSGQVLGPNNGEYITDKNGRIVITGLTPGATITAKETKTVNGFLLDTTPQSILIKQGAAQTLTFFNKRIGGLELIKVNEADKTQRIPGVTFEIRRTSDSGLVDIVTTDKNGRVYINLDAGNYYAVEIEAAEGFKLDNTPHYFEVKDGKTTTLTVTNKAFSGILIHKTDSVTGKGIYGVTFLLYDSSYTPIGQYTSDNSGYIYIEGLTTAGRYYLRELSNDGYIVDTQVKTVYVAAGETTLIEWANTPITGQIQITKKSADYNPINGLPAGTLLEGAIFEIYDKAGNLVDTIRSDSRGLAVSKQLPLDRYTIREVKAPDNYGISGEDLTAYLDCAGQIVRFEVTNKSLTTGVSITKTGPNEIMAGQPVNYVFSGIANNSNVGLDNFYWRDILPSEVRLDTIITGTYNFPGTYKIVYRVNGGEYRTLADSLSTSKNYTLAASATALGLASNERVTEIMFVFGQAPAGFAQVEKPMLYCTAVSNITTTSFVNVADVGGVYNSQWVQAISRWVTTVYKPVIITLPRTGY